MCNCSKGVLDEGIEIGRRIGIEISRQINMQIGGHEGMQLLAKAISECTTNTTVEDLIANGYSEDVAKMAIYYTNEIEKNAELMCNCGKDIFNEGIQIQIGRQIGIEIGRQIVMQISRQEGMQLLAKAISECTTNTTVEDLITKGYSEDVAKMAIECKK